MLEPLAPLHHPGWVNHHSQNGIAKPTEYGKRTGTLDPIHQSMMMMNTICRRGGLHQLLAVRRHSAHQEPIK